MCLDTLFPLVTRTSDFREMDLKCQSEVQTVQKVQTVQALIKLLLQELFDLDLPVFLKPSNTRYHNIVPMSL